MSLFGKLARAKPSDLEVTRDRCRAEEAKTHRHLTPGECVANGDIYGGADWGFITVVGEDPANTPRAGEPCDNLVGYRVRRKK